MIKVGDVQNEGRGDEINPSIKRFQTINFQKSLRDIISFQYDIFIAIHY
jgi:hypothetical protein